MTINSIGDGAIMVLKADDVKQKVSLSHQISELWFNGELKQNYPNSPPTRPGRPQKPELIAPQNMPRRRNAKARAARIAMLHAIGHIELNAIDLAWDIIARFGDLMPKKFNDDWVKVADDEARHFDLINGRLLEYDSFYGALPAHDGLWQSAEYTAHDLLARLAIVPLVLEARGLDVTPKIIENFKASGDQKSVEALNIIYQEEISHVGAGFYWFNYLCDQKNLPAEATYQALVTKYFTGSLKPPFNIEARNKAGFMESFYQPLSKR